MRSLTKKPSSSGGPTRRLRSMRGAQGSGDQQSRQIARIRKQLGNQAMGKSGNAAQMRETLLGFICERLRVLRGIQLKEHKEFKNVRAWFRNVARGEAGFHVPDPTRWHETARTFKEAAEAMCHGNLARGAQLLERAIGLEKAAYDSMPNQVTRQLEAEEKSPSGYPSEMPQALDEAALPRCPTPAALALADQILSLNDEFFENPPLRGRRRRAGWWEQDEEEEEDEKKEGAKGPAAGESGAQADQAAAKDEEEEKEDEQERPAHEQSLPEKREEQDRAAPETEEADLERGR